MKNSFNETPFEKIPEPGKPEDKKVFNTAPGEIDSDYIEPEEGPGIIGSGRDQMSEEEFSDFISNEK